MIIYMFCILRFREEFGVQREPYEDEIKLCNTLINYLQKFQVNEEDDVVEVEEVSKNPGKA